MFRDLTAFILRSLRVPPEPCPPHGDAASLRVFRAGKNLYRLRLFRWILAQTIALAGIIFWVAVFLVVEAEVRDRQRTQQPRINPTEVRDFNEFLQRARAGKAEDVPSAEKQPQPAAAPKAKSKSRPKINGWADFKLLLVQLALWLPAWAFPLLWALKIAGILVYVAQLPVTYLVVRVDYELRWFMVTDRSLRIRHGVWKISEATMSFANIQQVSVTRGPLQRLLGLSSVRVQSAGGGGGGHPGHGDSNAHHGLFENVTNAPEIRDLILERLRCFRATGLGDADERPEPHAALILPAVASPEILAAAHELLGEARALRTTLSAPN